MTVTEAADRGGRRGVGLNLLLSEPRDLGADLHLGTNRLPYLYPDARIYNVVPHRNPHGIPRLSRSDPSTDGLSDGRTERRSCNFRTDVESDVEPDIKSYPDADR